MKKLLSAALLLTMIMLLSVTPFAAVTYKPEGFYTVSADTPTCEEAIIACGGDLTDVQKVYFQLPPEDAEHPENNWTNHFNSTDLGVDDCQVCVYWWNGIGFEWSDGTKIQWVGYKAKLIDAQNRIYEAAIPADDVSPIIWNNGVYGGADPSQEIFRYAHQLKDADVTGAELDAYETLPEGSPDPDTMDGCIQIVSREDIPAEAFSNIGLHSFDWYVYYGDGCYGSYPADSLNYHGQYASCMNPEHDHSVVVYLRGDADKDKAITVIDATVIQRKLLNMTVPAFNEKAADVGDDGLDITDAARIQRYLVALDDPYYIGEYVNNQ